MMNPVTQKDVGNAVLKRAWADSEDEQILLQFDRDVILKGGPLPVVILDGGFTEQLGAGAQWVKVSPGVIKTAAPWAIMPGEPFVCFIPEDAHEIASANGGRVLAAMMVGHGE